MRKKEQITAFKPKDRVDVLCSSTHKAVFRGVIQRLTKDKKYAYLAGSYNTENFPKIRSKGRVEINVAIENLRVV